MRLHINEILKVTLGFLDQCAVTMSPSCVLELQGLVGEISVFADRLAARACGAASRQLSNWTRDRRHDIIAGDILLGAIAAEDTLTWSAARERINKLTLYGDTLSRRHGVIQTGRAMSAAFRDMMVVSADVPIDQYVCISKGQREGRCVVGFAISHPPRRSHPKAGFACAAADCDI